LDAYEARRRPNQTQAERWQAYPDPEIEKRRLEVFQKMIEVTQSLIDRQNVNLAKTETEPTRKSLQVEPEKEVAQEKKSKR
ncbi:hypothetical protein, partial [Escherichia coli]|uniref:hypothetical protein n=1 Tax=Escherichia coli TaxID=562 RepID=UPI00142D23A0